MEEKVIAGLLVLIGIVTVLKPQFLIEYKKWVSKVIYKAEYNESKATHTVQRIAGVIFILVGLWVLR